VVRNIQLALDKRPVYDELRALVSEAAAFPRFHLLPHRFEVPLHAVHPNGEDIHEAEVFRVLCQHRLEHATDNVAKPSSGTKIISASDVPRYPATTTDRADYTSCWATASAWQTKSLCAKKNLVRGREVSPVSNFPNLRENPKRLFWKAEPS
jgi:hypothetical protein